MAAAVAAIKAYYAKKTDLSDCIANQVGSAGDQGLTTMNVLEALACRGREGEHIGKCALAVPESLGPVEANAILLNVLEDIADLQKKRHSMLVIASDAARRDESITGDTVVIWHNQFDTYGHFKMDERGAGCKEWILTEDDRLQILPAYLRSEKRVSFSKVVEFINEKLLTNQYTDSIDAQMKYVYDIVKAVRGNWCTR